MTVRTGRVNGLPCVQVVETWMSIQIGSQRPTVSEEATPWYAGFPEDWEELCRR